MEYLSPVMMPIHWAEFYADLKKCQEAKDTLNEIQNNNDKGTKRAKITCH
jgi:hypothetical protein